MQIQDIVRKRQLLTIFREGKDGQEDMDVAILQALLKGEGQANWGEREKRNEGARDPEFARDKKTTSGSDALVRGQLAVDRAGAHLTVLQAGGCPAAGVGGSGSFLQLLCFTGARKQPH